MRIFLGSFLLFMTLGAAGLMAVFHFGGRDLPSPTRLNTIAPALKTRVYDREDRLIGEFYTQDRSLVRLEEIPRNLVNAFLAVEDRRFYTHWGIDLQGVGRATVRNVASGRIRQGASTITQQLARNLFLTFEQTAQRKLKEAVLALRIEQTYSKDEILEMYLNQIYFGDGAYGVSAASRRIFGKDVRDLDLTECALLAGLPRNPRNYSPRRHPERALQRRGVVLAAMEDFEVITPAQRKAADTDSLDVTTNPMSPTNAPYFMEMVRRYLETNYGSTAIYEDGLRVYTTLDLHLQQEAERALEEHLARIESDFRRSSSRTSYLAAHDDGEDIPPEYLQGAVLTVDAPTGGVLAVVGGRSFEESPFNRATQAKRQPGSAFKPFVFLAALERGFYPSSMMMDSPVVYEERGQEPWSPRNYDEEFRGPVSLRYTLQKSLNVPTVKLQEEFGPEAVIELARAAGITSRIPPVRSIALGTAEVSLEEITYAYGVFANDGILVEPYFVARVEDRYGNLVEEFHPQRREAINTGVVAVLNDMLASVIDDGTGKGARSAGFTLPAGGKTGTTDDYTDAWFVGFTPKVVTGVWVGYDIKKTIGRKMTGAAAALPIWSRVMIAATEGDDPLPLDIPESVLRIEVCPDTGLPAAANCPAGRIELFLPTHVPSETCYLHEAVFDGKLRQRWDRFGGDEDDEDRDEP